MESFWDVLGVYIYILYICVYVNVIPVGIWSITVPESNRGLLGTEVSNLWPKRFWSKMNFHNGSINGGRLPKLLIESLDWLYRHRFPCLGFFSTSKMVLESLFGERLGTGLVSLSCHEATSKSTSLDVQAAAGAATSSSAASRTPLPAEGPSRSGSGYREIHHDP